MPKHAAKTKVSSGTDGDFRMVIDSKYEQMARYRKAAKYIYPVFLLTALLKIATTFAPQLVDPDSVDRPALLAYGIGFGMGFFIWVASSLSLIHISEPTRPY